MLVFRIQELQRDSTPAKSRRMLQLWSRRTVIRVFEHQRGVVALRKPGGKRRTLRIPNATYLRVMAKFTVR
jgi:hypothetical protein